MPAPPAVRAATPDDVDTLVRLRRRMMALIADPLHRPVEGPAGPVDWEATARAQLAERLAAGTAVAFLAEAEAEIRVDPDAPGARVVVGGGVGLLAERLASPWNPTGRYGEILSMVTEPGWQRRGIAGEVVDRLLAWFTARGITRVELTATAAGEPVYRARGFAERSDLAMRWTSPPP
jgi:GNAT superfamily N-acetyltransferase